MAFGLIFTDLPLELYLPLWIPASFLSYHFKDTGNDNLLLWVQSRCVICTLFLSVRLYRLVAAYMGGSC